jgi:tRNA A37 threonylcarbamoyladenosine dehydratase
VEDLRFLRCQELFGEDYEKIVRAKVLILGVGGVGSFVLDCLHRSGVADITIVDMDRYDATNQNRQIGSEAVGAVKVERLAALYSGVQAIHAKIDDRFVEEFDFEPYDIVVDAVDDMRAKVAIAQKSYAKLISSMGSARKCDPTKIRSASIWKTHGDKLAKKFRYELKKAGFNGDFLALFSDEEPCSDHGSFVGVTGSFGLAVCSEVIKKIRYTCNHSAPI